MTFLSKDKLVEELNKCSMIAQHLDCMDVFDAINKSIIDDVVNVTRCKDCKHGRICDNPILGKIVDCQNGTPYVYELDWFCADGERK